MLSSTIKNLKDKRLLPILAIAGVSIILILLPLSFKVAFSRILSDTIYYPIFRLDTFLTDVASAKSDNLKLSRHLIEASLRAARYTKDHYENIRLRRMLNFDLQIPYKLVPVEVVGLNPNPAVKSITVNAGENKGIKVNMPAVTADGIVGKIIAVSSNSAAVQFLIDHNCKVSAIDQNSRAMGIVRWEGGRFLKMGDVPVDNKVAVGDTIVSSGLGGIFPPGLIIGTVVYQKDPEAALFKDIAVKPAVNFSSLEEVFVIINDE